MKYQPTRDNVAIRLYAKKEKTASGIVLPTEQKEQVEQGRVLARGPEATEIRVGDKVLFRNVVSPFMDEGERTVITNQKEILAIL